MSIQPKSTTTQIPTICLNMIVKNESKVILRLLDTVVSLIDSYCICDTGSTDNTVELIETFMKDHHITGKIVFEPFRDFGYNRTFALNEASKMVGQDYLLLMDADMYLTGDALLDPISFKKSLKKDCFHLCQGSHTYFYKNVRIIKNYKGYSYWGVTHEYVVTPQGTEYDFIENNTLFIQDIGDGGTKTDKFERDIRLLTKGLEENPNNDRYTFYLANSLRDAGRIQEAIEMFKKRIKIGGWIEEVWHSYYSMGKCYMTIGEHEKAVSTWLDAYNHHPKRIENLYEIINYYRMAGKNRLAYSFYILANDSNVQWGASADYLFLQKDVYDYKIDYELSIIGYYVNDLKYDLLRTCMKVLAYEYLTEDIATNILSNYKFYRKQISQETNMLSSQQLDLLNHLTDTLNIDPAFVKSTPSILKRENHFIINTRYVNYRIDENGRYVNQSNIITKNVISVVDISKPIWKVVQEFELKYDTSNDGYYIGLEDIRLSLNGSQIVYNANRGMPDGTMQIEHGIILLDEETTIHSKSLKLDSGNKSTEKNWVLFPNPDSASLTCVYNWNPSFTVGNIIENKLIVFCSTKVPYFFRFLRGSTNGVLIQGEIWFICHAVSYEDRRYYYHIVVVVDPQTYDIKRYTPLFSFEGSHVEYTLGFVYFDTIDHLLIGYSVYDKTTQYLQLPRTFFEKDMIKI
jgi:tetratricopeptide (TPR) repeat protein